MGGGLIVIVPYTIVVRIILRWNPFEFGYPLSFRGSDIVIVLFRDRSSFVGSFSGSFELFVPITARLVTELKGLIVGKRFRTFGGGGVKQLGVPIGQFNSANKPETQPSSLSGGIFTFVDTVTDLLQVMYGGPHVALKSVVFMVLRIGVHTTRVQR